MTDRINPLEVKFNRTQICHNNQLFKVDKDCKESIEFQGDYWYKCQEFSIIHSFHWLNILPFIQYLAFCFGTWMRKMCCHNSGDAAKDPTIYKNGAEMKNAFYAVERKPGIEF